MIKKATISVTVDSRGIAALSDYTISNYIIISAFDSANNTRIVIPFVVTTTWWVQVIKYGSSYSVATNENLTITIYYINK